MTSSGPTASRTFSLQRLWFPAALLVVGLYSGLPWLAPVFMRLGWTQAAGAVYGIYSTQCHQLAQRSYFLFGPKLMYSPEELGVASAREFPALRAYTGTPDVGWKMAWSDRMTAMYSGLFVSLVVVRLLGRRLKALPVWAFLLLLLPMAVDGGSHFLSDFSGFGQGFRDSNRWLAALTGNLLPASFFAGDAWGSFNALLRLVTGILFGVAVAWFAAPRIEASFQAGDEAGARALRREAARDALRKDLDPVYNSRAGGLEADLSRSAPRDGGT